MGGQVPDPARADGQRGEFRAAPGDGRGPAVGAAAEIAASRAGQRLLRSLLRAAYRHPSARADKMLAETGFGNRRLLIRAGIGPGAPVADVTAEQWHRLAVMLSW